MGDSPTQTNVTADAKGGKSDKRKEVVQDLQVEARNLAGLTELDMSTLDSNYTYRWVNSAPLKVARARANGYVMVDSSEEEILNAVGESPEAEDGTYRVGDCVLMKIKKLPYKARRKAVQRTTKSRLKGPTKKFQNKAESSARQRGLDNIEVITDKEPD